MPGLVPGMHVFLALITVQAERHIADMLPLAAARSLGVLRCFAVLMAAREAPLGR
jgi:hypothetical protein